jgi:perosamine synthetase
MDIPLAMPEMTEEMRAEADRVLKQEFFVGGETIDKFEAEFAEFVGADYAVGVNSGTQALHLSLRALGVGEGDTVVTTPATFIATANSIVRTGADVAFVDVNLDSYTIDIDKLADIANEKDDIAAIIETDLYGYPTDVDRIREVAPDIPIVSDACQAHGASLRGQRVGSMADMTAFSFYPSKNMTVGGDGGMITTNDRELARLARSYSDVGRAVGDADYDHPRIGYTARLDTFKAAIGRKQLEQLPEWNEQRATIAAKYTTAFEDLDGLTLPPSGDGDVTPAWYFYVVRTPRRDELAEHLESRGVETGVHYPTPIHLQPPYLEREFSTGDFPKSEQWAKEVLSLPVHPHLSDEQVEYVIEAVRDFF